LSLFGIVLALVGGRLAADTISLHLPVECVDRLPLRAVLETNQPQVLAAYLETVTHESFQVLRQEVAALPSDIGSLLASTADFDLFRARVKALPANAATGLAPEEAAWWVANRLAPEVMTAFYRCANPGPLNLQPIEPMGTATYVTLRLTLSGLPQAGPIPLRWAAVNLEPSQPLPQVLAASGDTVITFVRSGEQLVNVLVEADVGDRVERARFTDPGVTGVIRPAPLVPLPSSTDVPSKP
jgi:hypothetical protein